VYDLLTGIRVVEVAAWVFVPTAGTVLADWGAEVVKVEDPVSGDPLRGLYNALTTDGGVNLMYETSNRNKRCVGVNLKSPDGRAVLSDLVRTADVFLTNMRAPARQKLGIGLDDIRADNPDVIYALGTGYGSRGAEADKPGFDAAASWARAGIAHQMRAEDGTPPMVPASVGDLVGGLTLAGGVAAAIAGRERTGRPTEVEVSLLATGMWLMAQNITAAPMGGVGLPSRREESRNPITVPYRTKDDRWIHFVMLQSQRIWPDFCRRIGRTDLLDDARFATADAREMNARECMAVLDDVFAGKVAAEWQEALEGIDGVWDLVKSPVEMSSDPQALANGYLPDVEACDGSTYRGVASPVQFGGAPIGALSGSPIHGQHTEEVLLELGLTWERLIELKESGAIL
jgi:crotonobetainyl-CoA:carnitine CoA-transferase CaiB-like acyl-CoA transferase